MRSEYRTIWKHGRIYLVSNVVSRAAGLLLLPVYAKLLTPTEFGVYALIAVVVDLVTSLVSAGLGRAMVPIYVQQSDPRSARAVVSTVLIASLGMSVLFLLGATAVSHPISVVLFREEGYAGAVALAISGVAFLTLFQIELFVYRMKKRSGIYLLAAFGKAVLLLGLNILFVVVLRLGVAGIFLGNLIAFAILSLGMLAALLREDGIAFSIPVLREVLRVGWPLIPTVLLDISGTFAERYLLNIFLTTAHVGVYTFGSRLAQFLQMFIATPFYQIWVVRRMEVSDGKSGDRVFLEIFHFFIVALTTAALALAMLAPEIIIVAATPEYLAAAEPIAFLALAFVLSSVRLEAETSIVRGRRTEVLPLIAVASLAGGLAVTIGLIWAFGLIGAAIGALLRQALHLTLMQIVAARLFPDRPLLPFGRLICLGLIAAGYYVVSRELFGTPSFMTALEKLALCGLFVATVAISPAIGPNGRAKLLTGFGRLRTKFAR